MAGKFDQDDLFMDFEEFMEEDDESDEGERDESADMVDLPNSDTGNHWGAGLIIQFWYIKKMK